MDKIKILFVFHGKMSKGGTEQVMTTIFDNIDKEAFEIDFLIISDVEDNSEEKEHFISNGAQFYYVTGKKKNYFRHFKELNEFFATEKYDIVHSHINAVGNGVFSIAKKHGVKVRIAHSHNTWHMLKVRNLKSAIHYSYLEIERLMIRRTANYFIGCSNEAGKWLFGSKIVNSPQYMLLNNSIDIKKFLYDENKRNEVRNKYNLEKYKVLGHVGRFDYQKNHEFIIEVFREILKIDNQWKLMLVGDGEFLESIEKMAKNYGIEENVLFMGSRNDVPELLQAMDAFIFPSRYEGLGISVVEAQIAGLKCFVSDNVPKEAFITDNVCVEKLSERCEQWAKLILENYKSCDRELENYCREKCGYDVSNSVKKLESFYTMGYCVEYDNKNTQK